MQRLSLVMQGPMIGTDGEIDTSAIENVLLARRHYPQAEIIISTWRLGAKQQEILKALLEQANVQWVWSQDPGPLRVQIHKQQIVSNLNRLLVSAYEGIRASSREIVVKLRTDCRIENNNLLPLLETRFSAEPLLKQSETFRVFSRHVINANLYARSPHGTRPFLYHPGDIFLMGRREDVLAFFTAPLATNDLMDPYGRRQPFAFMRRVPEQYFWMHCIMRQQEIDLTDYDLLLTPANRRTSDRYYVSNFYPLSPQDLGFEWLKLSKEYRWKDRWLSIYLPAEWQQIYKREVLGQHPGLNGILLLRKVMVQGVSRAYSVRDFLLRRRRVLHIIFRLFGRHRRQMTQDKL